MLQAQLAALVLAATALAATGCGSSSKDGTSTSASITSTSTDGEAVKSEPAKSSSAEWIAKAEAICAHTNKQLDSAKLTSLKQYATVLPLAAGYDRTESTELGALTPPASMAKDWQVIVTGYRQFGDYTEQVAVDAQQNKLSDASPLLAAARKVHEHVDAVAKHDGFKECALV